MTPVESYRADLRRGKIRLDAAQAAAVHHTQRLYEDLLKAQPAHGTGSLIGSANDWALWNR